MQASRQGSWPASVYQSELFQVVPPQTVVWLSGVVDLGPEGEAQDQKQQQLNWNAKVQH